MVQKGNITPGSELWAVWTHRTASWMALLQSEAPRIRVTTFLIQLTRFKKKYAKRTPIIWINNFPKVCTQKTIFSSTVSILHSKYGKTACKVLNFYPNYNRLQHTRTINLMNSYPNISWWSCWHWLFVVQIVTRLSPGLYNRFYLVLTIYLVLWIGSLRAVLHKGPWKRAEKIS